MSQTSTQLAAEAIRLVADLQRPLNPDEMAVVQARSLDFVIDLVSSGAVDQLTVELP